MRPNYRPNAFLVDIRQLSPRMQELVRHDLQKRIARRTHRLTYKEASVFYGVGYESIKTYVYEGRIQTVGKGRGKRRITHQEMRRFLLSYFPRMKACELPSLKPAISRYQQA